MVISDFVYETDKYGRKYGWGVAEYSTPERTFGDDFCRKVYMHSPEESYIKVLSHLKELFPEVNEKLLVKMMR